MHFDNSQANRAKRITLLSYGQLETLIDMLEYIESLDREGENRVDEITIMLGQLLNTLAEDHRLGANTLGQDDLLRHDQSDQVSNIRPGNPSQLDEKFD